MTTPEQREELRRLLADPDWLNAAKMYVPSIAFLPALLDDADELERVKGLYLIDDCVRDLTVERDTLKAQLTAAQERVASLKRQDEVHWKTRRTLLANIDRLQDRIGCGCSALDSGICNECRAAMKEQP